MGGHGGLNILPQKSWHVYRLDNRLKVDKDKEAAERRRVIKHDKQRSARLNERLRRTRSDYRRDHSEAEKVEDNHSVTSHELLVKNINLFEAEQEEAEASAKKHQEIITKKLLHDSTAKPAFEINNVPWYARKPEIVQEETGVSKPSHQVKKKSIQELRAERLKREKVERLRSHY